MVYNHFNIETRFKIQAWKDLKLSKAEMARRLNKDYSSVLREIKNNSYDNGVYEARHANALARKRRKAGKKESKILLSNNGLRTALINGMKAKKSPEQIMGERKREGKSFVCHETVYEFIYSEQRDLIKFLRQKKGKYRRRHGTKKREKERELSKKRRIDERPREIEERMAVGHWEGDTVVSRYKENGIATYVERVSGYGKGIKLESLKAEELKEKTIKSLSLIPRKKRKTITCDNGSEFAEYETIENRLKMVFYFANPYHSWERGSNENWNGLLRQYFPKGTNFDKITQREIDKAVREINHRPRKRLNYLTPHQVFVKGMDPKDYCTSS